MNKGGKALASIEEKVENLILKPVEDLGYELYDVQYAKEGKDYFLRVFIDKEEGIDLEDCEKVSNEINPLLDEKDIIKEMYFLEVSSPGIERVLRKEKHFKQALGKEVEIKLFKPIEKKKEYSGKLEKWNKTTIYLQLEDTTQIEMERKNISLMKLKYNWN